MKKALSLILTVCMLLTTVAGIGTVFAEDILDDNGSVLAGEGAQMYVVYGAYEDYNSFFEPDDEEFTPDNTTDDGELIMARVILKGILTADTLAVGIEYDPSKVQACTTKSSGAIQYTPADSKYKAANSVVLVDEDAAIRVTEHHDAAITTTGKNVIFAVVTGEYEQTSASDEIEVFAFKFKRLDTETPLSECGFGFYAPVTDAEKGAYYTAWISAGTNIAFSQASDAVMGAGGVYVHPEMFGSNLGGGVTPPEPVVTLDSIDLAIDKTELEIDETANVTVTATYSDGTTEDVTAATTFTYDETAVSIADGVLTALKAGSYTINAYYNEKTAQQGITINEAAPVLQAITLTIDPSTLDIDGTASVQVMASYDKGDDVDVTANATFSYDSSIVSITGATLTAVAAGTASVTASYGDLTSDAVEVTVNEATPIVTLESITIAVDKTELEIGETANVTVTAIMSDGTQEDVTANATINALGAVSANGAVITAVEAGTGYVSASYQDKASDRVEITVNAPAPVLSSVTLTVDPTTLDVDATASVTVKAVYDNGTVEDATDAQFTFDDSIISIAAADTFVGYVLTALAAGTTTLTATVDGVTSNEVTITVNEPAPAEKANFTLNAGEVYEKDDKRFVDVTLNLDQNVGNGLYAFVFEIAYDKIFTLSNVNKKKLQKQANDLLPYNISANPAVNTENGIRLFYTNEEDPLNAEMEAFVDDTSSAPLLTMVFEVADGAYGVYPISFVIVDDATAHLPDLSDNTFAATTDLYNFVNGEIDLGEEPAEPVITAITLTIEDTELDINDFTEYTVKAIYDNGSEEEVTDVTFDGIEGVLEESDGSLKAIGAGEANVVAKYGNFSSDPVVVTVNEPFVKAVESIDFVVIDTDLEVGETTDYQVIVNYNDGDEEDITDTATIDGLGDILVIENGALKAVKAGEAVLSVTVDNVTSDEITVTVTAPAPQVTDIVIELEAGASTDLTVGDSINYTVKKIYDDGSEEDITDTAVVDVEGDAVTAENGVISAVAAGSAELTVTVGDITSEPITINVEDAPAPVVGKKGNVLTTDEDIDINDVTRLAQYLAKWASVAESFDDTTKYNANVYRADQYYMDGETKVNDFDADFGTDSEGISLNPNNAFLFLNSKDITKLLQYVNDLDAVAPVWNVDLNAAN